MKTVVLLSAFSIITICSSVFSQEKYETGYTLQEEVATAPQDVIGTFQISMAQGGQRFIISKSHIELIQGSRKENEDVTIELESGINVYIPSSKKIRAASFIGLEPIVYI